MHPLRLLLRLRHALVTAWQAGVRAWDVAGSIDSRLRRQQLRMALLDGDELHRLYHARPSDACREELRRRGLPH